MTDKMTIGQLAKKASVSLQTIRYYESLSLLPEPARTESGYRIYSDIYVEHLSFIKNAQELGFTLEEIQKLVNLKQAPTAHGNDVKEILHEKIQEVNEKIESFTKLKNYLEALNGSCSGEMTTDCCPIIQSLSKKQGEEKAQASCH